MHPRKPAPTCAPQSEPAALPLLVRPRPSQKSTARSSAIGLAGSRFDDPFTFHDGHDPVDRWNLDLFLRPVRPDNFYFVDLRGRPQAKMRALIGTGAIAATAENVGPLPTRAGGDKHLGTDRIPRTVRPTDQFEREPMMRI